MISGKDDRFLLNRIKDLANKCYRSNVYTFTDFLSLADAAAYYSVENELGFVEKTVWGGAEGCERVVVRFGGSEQLGYEERFPISVIHISALMKKFSDDLTHRDVLGALMNLGIEREVLGDINICDKDIYVFCLDKIAEYICENLSRIKHTSVICKITNDLPENIIKSTEERIVQIQSVRIDSVIAKVYNMSRSQCSAIFPEKKVFVNGRQCENNSYQLKDSDMVTVRGLGRFTFVTVTGTSRKGKLNAQIKIW